MHGPMNVKICATVRSPIATVTWLPEFLHPCSEACLSSLEKVFEEFIYKMFITEHALQTVIVYNRTCAAEGYCL